MRAAAALAGGAALRTLGRKSMHACMFHRNLITGTLVATYKGNAAVRRGVCTLGRDYLVAAQHTKHAPGLVNVQCVYHCLQVMSKATFERKRAEAEAAGKPHSSSRGVRGTIWRPPCR